MDPSFRFDFSGIGYLVIEAADVLVKPEDEGLVGSRLVRYDKRRARSKREKYTLMMKMRMFKVEKMMGQDVDEDEQG